MPIGKSSVLVFKRSPIPLPDTSVLQIARKHKILLRCEIEGLIAEGRTILIVDGKVLKVDAWLRYHPGGHKAIMHMVGRDATHEVNAWVELFRLQVLYL